MVEENPDLKFYRPKDHVSNLEHYIDRERKSVV